MARRPPKSDCVPESIPFCPVLVKPTSPSCRSQTAAGWRLQRLSLHEECRGVALHQAAQRGLFRAVAFVVDRGFIWRPLGLPADGLHDGLPML